MEEQRLVLFWRVVDTADHQFQIHRKDIALERDMVSKVPAKTCHQVFPHNTGPPFLYPGLLLVLWHGVFRVDSKEDVGLHAETGEEVVKIATVFVGPAEPLRYRNGLHPRDLPDLIAIKQR